MKQNYILVDTLNMFMRAKHVGGGNDIDMRIGMAMHIMFNSVKKVWRNFNGSHVVFCLEGRSWRKDFYIPYKANRKVLRDQRKPREIEDDELYFEAYNDMIQYFNEKTNTTVIRQAESEADDLIAIWIQEHPDDNHIIVSTDSDFYQLMAPNVMQYNGTTDQIVSLDGFIEAKTGKRVIDKKTKKEKELPDPKWLLFEKCIRGDSSDNVFSAYPGARKKGSRNRTGMLEAYNDIETGGFNYNNFMLQRWVDHNEKEHRVIDDYERNKILIDLSKQPDEIKDKCKKVIVESKAGAPVSNVGIHFMKFCNRWNLQRMSETPTDYAEILNSSINTKTEETA
jgi:5'-3' exonuclease